MSKNETTRNLARVTPEPSSPARAPEKDTSEKSPGAMPLDGRIEKRAPMAVPVYLVAAEGLLIAERAITVNLSPHGARVITKRRWQAEEQPWLASLFNEFRLQARVVYCQPLTDGHFCVVLRFKSRLINFGDHP
jgi:hypothetical protein